VGVSARFVQKEKLKDSRVLSQKGGKQNGFSHPSTI
jgi:hypothetical protein